MSRASERSHEEVHKLTYHYDHQRTGWNDAETLLTPETVSGGRFGLKWQSPQFDFFGEVPPLVYATPLYVDRVDIPGSSSGDRTLSVIYAVTSTGYAYAVNAFQGAEVPPGEIVWRSQLTDRPCSRGIMGNRSTPVIDIEKRRLYVTSCDDEAQWQVHALDIRTGKSLAGWPVTLGHSTINAPGVNNNGTTRFPEERKSIQRGALNLSRDGSRLYVTFGGDYASGWIVSVDTESAGLASAFSSTAVTEEHQGGMWASAGPSIDHSGNIYIATGASIAFTQSGAGIDGVFPDSAHNWGQSVLRFTDEASHGFRLTGTYTPFNYCQSAAADIDLGSTGTVVIDLNDSSTDTPHLLALGANKQGNVYLLDRFNMAEGLTKRPPCSENPESDQSLLSPRIQPQFGTRGPLNVFGPYSEVDGMMDQAKSRSTLAYFKNEAGERYVFVTGSAKTGKDASISTPPGLARLKIVTKPGSPAYLEIDKLERTQTLQNPGSPIVTSNGAKDGIVWVLDTNAPRSAPMYGAGAPQPVLYAFNAENLELLAKSKPGELSTSGKYNEPTVVRGMAFIGTDRIEAFGLGKSRLAQESSPSMARSSEGGAPGGKAATAPDSVSVRLAQSIYEQRCRMCHESGRPGIATKDEMAERTREFIVEKLTFGAMQNMAFGLSDAEIWAVADYISGSE